MDNIKNKSSVLLSIFRRKGGEGEMTKILNNENKLTFIKQIALLKIGEEPLICFKQNELNWLLLTSARILEEKCGVRFSIPYSELTEVTIAMQEEYKEKVMNKMEFTRLVLQDKNGMKHIITVESGGPFHGIYQILHHIASNTRRDI